MRLQKSTEYSIRCLVYIALSDRELVSVDHLAKSLDLPYKFLTRLMSALRKAELVEAVRGKYGGFKIIRPLEDIKLIEVLEATEGTEDFHRCILGFPECGDEAPCAMHKHWAAPRERLRQMAEAVSLADLSMTESIKL